MDVVVFEVKTIAIGGINGIIEPFFGKKWASWLQCLSFYFVTNDVSR